MLVFTGFNIGSFLVGTYKKQIFQMDRCNSFYPDRLIGVIADCINDGQFAPRVMV
jgi:hypothetical protein